MFPMMLFFFYLVGSFKCPLCLANIAMLMFDMSKSLAGGYVFGKSLVARNVLEMSNIGCLMFLDPPPRPYFTDPFYG